MKGKLPIIAWGNGGCANNGLSHRNFLMEIASHGYLAIAIGPPIAPPARQGGPARSGRVTAGRGGARWTCDEIVAADRCNQLGAGRERPQGQSL